MTGTTMAKAKGRPAKKKALQMQGQGFRTIGVRVSDQYAEWLNRAARHDRQVSVAAFIDRAVVERAKAIGFDEPAPDRIT